MKICLVNAGILPVQEQGIRRYGAVEKILGEYECAFESMGHSVEILYLNEISQHQFDIVHIHMANLALQAHERGIPYIFSLHDHHAEYYGKDSQCFKDNLAAMKHSIFSITHSEHLLRYFSETDKLFYLPHGVNTNYFEPNIVRSPDIQLLMVANNGLAGNYGIDRKGFGIGIEAAKKLGLPITIVGTQSNNKFFELHPELQYDKLSILSTNPTEEEVLELYQSSHIFLHPSMIEAGTPNLTLLEAAACCLPIVGRYNGSNEITGLYRAENNVMSVIVGIEDTIDNYFEIVKAMEVARKQYDWEHVCRRLIKMYQAIHFNDNNMFPTAMVDTLYKTAYSC